MYNTHIRSKVVAMMVVMAIFLSLFPKMTIAASEQIGYFNAISNTYEFATATKLATGTNTLEDGWYYVEGTINRNAQLMVSGDVHLILTDGAYLSISSHAGTALCVPENASLTIYAQSSGSNKGRLYAFNDGISGGSGIGGYDENDGKNGAITIHGGGIEAMGAANGAGIGSTGPHAQSGKISIYGGTVSAYGGTYAAGIGGRFNGGEVEITGGIVTAYGGLDAAGIGGGQNSAGGIVHITGGHVEATGGGGYGDAEQGGAGIGGGRHTALGHGDGIGKGGTVEISNSGTVVIAKGTKGSHDIGSGHNGAGGGSLTVRGGAQVILANSGTDAKITLQDGAAPLDNTIWLMQNWTQEAFSDFSTQVFGYPSIPEQKFTLAYDGVGYLGITFSLSEDSAFQVSGASTLLHVSAANPQTIFISPKDGLSAGVYEETLTIAKSPAKDRDFAHIGLSFVVRETQPQAVISYPDDALTGFVAGGTYLINGASHTANERGQISFNHAWMGKQLTIIKVNADPATNSDSQSLVLPSRPAAPIGVEGVAETIQGRWDGQITGLSAGMEYRRQGENDWYVAVESSVGGIKPGVYEVRYCATAYAPASQSTQVVVADGAGRTFILSVTSPVFEDVIQGYDRPAAKPILLRNDGNSEITILSVSLPPMAGFTLVGNGRTIVPGEQISSWMICPVADLPAGEYSIQVTFTYDGGSVSAPISFVVHALADGPVSVPSMPAQEERVKLPVIVTVPIKAINDGGNPSIFSPSERDVENALQHGKITSGGSELKIALHLIWPREDVQAYTITLRRAMVESLVAETVGLQINSGAVALGFDKAALVSLLAQGEGDVVLSVTPTDSLSTEAKALIGTRPAYDITITTMKAGKPVNVSYLGSGSITIGIAYEPKSQEMPGYLYAAYVDDQGQVSRVANSAYDANNGLLRLSTNHLSVFAVAYTSGASEMSDIDAHWAKESIDYVLGRGLLDGATKTTFSPDDPLTRLQLAVALGKFAQIDIRDYKTASFSDITKKNAARPYVEWADQNGIMKTRIVQKFAPDAPLTKEELAQSLYRFSQATVYSVPVLRKATAFSDTFSLEQESVQAILAMQQAGIFAGNADGQFQPEAYVSRGEMAVVLHRLALRMADADTAQGWAMDDAGALQYYKEGIAVNGWQKIDDEFYFFQNSRLQAVE